MTEQLFQVAKIETPAGKEHFPCAGWVRITDEDGTQADAYLSNGSHKIIHVPAFDMMIRRGDCAATVEAAYALYA